jgi:hypothetical protein
MFSYRSQPVSPKRSERKIKKVTKQNLEISFRGKYYIFLVYMITVLMVILEETSKEESKILKSPDKITEKQELSPSENDKNDKDGDSRIIAVILKYLNILEN